MASPFEFLQQVRSEATKVVWPSRRETLITTGMVLLMVVFTSFFFLVVDEGLQSGGQSGAGPRPRRLIRPAPSSRSIEDGIPHMNMRWYIVHAYSNFEKKVGRVDPRTGEPSAGAGQVRGDHGDDRAGRRGSARPQGQLGAQVLSGYVLVKCDLTDESTT